MFTIIQSIEPYFVGLACLMWVVFCGNCFWLSYVSDRDTGRPTAFVPDRPMMSRDTGPSVSRTERARATSLSA